MMEWTTTKPSSPGWYWWRFSYLRKPTVMFISKDHIEHNDVFTEGTLVMFLSEVPGEWAGPIAPPTERG